LPATKVVQQFLSILRELIFAERIVAGQCLGEFYEGIWSDTNFDPAT
jgi:hypothetical protein